MWRPSVRTGRASGWRVRSAAQSEEFRRVTLAPDDTAGPTIADSALSYDGDGRLLRLCLQAYALRIAYEIEPYFGLSISRVDPLPHQLEAVYKHLLKRAPAVGFLVVLHQRRIGSSTYAMRRSLENRARRLAEGSGAPTICCAGRRQPSTMMEG